MDYMEKFKRICKKSPGAQLCHINSNKFFEGGAFCVYSFDGDAIGAVSDTPEEAINTAYSKVRTRPTSKATKKDEKKKHAHNMAFKYQMEDERHDVKVLVACVECKESYFYLHSKTHPNGNLTTVIRPRVPSSDKLEFPTGDGESAGVA